MMIRQIQKAIQNMLALVVGPYRSLLKYEAYTEDNVVSFDKLCLVLIVLWHAQVAP